MSKEAIPDPDYICRLIDAPRMVSEDLNELVWENIFVFQRPKEPEDRAKFPNGGPESVVWRKYAPTNNEVHSKGCQREIERRERDERDNKPNKMRYLGFIEAKVGEIRNLTNKRGHGFNVEHEPGNNQGNHHAEIHIKPGETNDFDKTTDRPELIKLLKDHFGPLNKHSCNQ